jgi:hypothetical protein
MSAFRFKPEKIQVGQVYHYVKSNLDGSDPERVSLYVAAPDRIESYKFHPGASPAGWVMATMDWETFSAGRLESWQVHAEEEQDFVARLEYLSEARAVEVEIPMLGPGVDQVAIPHLPFHMYNFDLASLNFAFRHLADPDQPFTVGIIDPTFQPEGPAVVYRGEVELRFVGVEPRAGIVCRKYAMDGAGLDHRGGFIWVDQQGDHFVDVEIDLPDNPNWENFKFRLEGIEQMTAEVWQAFMARVIKEGDLVE